MEDDEERFKVLGFKPQREIVYNKLLPYSDRLDEESNKLFYDIKTNLVKSVLAREMYPGCVLWTSRLNRYIRIYGLKFSKEDHIALIKLYYELIVIPNLEPCWVNKFGATLHHLLKKKLLSPEDLQLEWRPLFDLCVRIMEKGKSEIGMYKYSPLLEGILENLIRICRIYFSPYVTQEILDEFRPYLCPYGTADITNAMEYLELFLPIVMKPEEKHLGYELWLDEFMHIWEVCHNASLWENHLTWLLARLASYNTGFIDWERYIPIMFVRFRRALQLPVSYRQRQSGKQYKIDASAMAVWTVCCLGGKSDRAFFHLEKFMQTLETYYHSANIGKWTPRVRELLKKLAYYFVQRVYCERFKKPTWELHTPDDFKLTDADIERFVNIMKPCLEQAMFSRQGNHDVAQAMQYMAALRSDIIVPMVLDKLYASMDSLTEPHKLTSSMMCIMSVARFMARGAKSNYPEGPTHVFPLITSLLPGIDPNDIRKCLMTFNLIAHFSNLAPLVNSSDANKYYELTEEEHNICEASFGLEDFVLQFIDRICAWVESNSLEFTRMEQTDNDHKSKLESISETALYSVITSLLYQCSPEIYTAALKKVYNFATNRILESKVSGRLVAILCACFAKTNSKETFKLFIPHLCDTIESLLGDDEMLKEEQLNDELLYNLLLLSEIVDGHSELLNYMERIIKILDRTLHLTSTQGSRLATQMLNLIMISLSLTHPLEYRSCNLPYSTHIKELFTVREWAEPADTENLNIKWYQPGKKEVDCIQQLLNRYLVPEVTILDRYSKGEITLDRKELRRHIRIVNAVLGCQSVLPPWNEPVFRLENSVTEPWSFNLEMGNLFVVTMPDGSNVRKLIADVLHNVQMKILAVDEGDTKSIVNIIFIYDILLFDQFRSRNFEAHWKNFSMLKKIIEDRLHQNKSYLRCTFIDRVMLQHEFRNESRTPLFTATHKQIMLDLFELGVCHYSEVRIVAQVKLFQATSTFPYSYTILVPRIKEILQLDTTEHHEKFKGCLCILLGTKNAPILTKHNWDLIKEVWPLLVKSKPSEKPSIVNLMNGLQDTIRCFPTISIKCQFSDKAISSAYNFANVFPLVPVGDFQYIIDGSYEKLEYENEKRVSAYTQTLTSLLDASIKGNLHWRYNSMALSFIRDLVHADVKYVANVVRFFVNALINDSLEIRKIAIRVFLFILIQNKPKFKKVVIDPFKMSGCKSQSKVTPGIRPDNRWLLYNSKSAPRNIKEWNELRFLHTRDLGYYAWPKKLEVYAPSNEQPTLQKRLSQLSEHEKEIIEFFNEKNLETWIKYLSLEEKKGRDQFSIFRFLVFKNLFKVFEDHFLNLFIPHLKRLSGDKQEESQRCAAEIIGGLISGSKHWDYDKIENLATVLLPILRTAFSNISVETIGDWIVSFAMAVDSRDPNRYHWLFEFLMDNPLSEQSSFIGCCRIYILQTVLNQQSWRNAELINRFLEYLKEHLAHPFQNVRDKISSCLTVIFFEGSGFSNGKTVVGPKVADFFKHVMPLLNNFYESTIAFTQNIEDNKEDFTTQRLKLINLNGDEDKDNVIRLFKTVAKYVTSSITRINYGTVPEHYELLPLACVLQSNETDDELTAICSNLLAVMCHTLILEQYVPAMLAALKKVAECEFWSARAAIAEFIPVLVFHNFATFINNPEWVSEIQQIVLTLLEDVQPEVRVKAGEVLSGFLHCHFVPDPSALLELFKTKSRTKLKTRNFNKASHGNVQVNNNRAIQIRHGGVIGMCAFVSCHPYDVPDYLSDIFLELGSHLNDPQPIPTTIRETLGNFKRTHHDNWDVHKLKFTEEELCLLSDLSVPPSYYA